MRQTLITADGWDGTAAGQESCMHLIIPGNWTHLSSDRCEELAGAIQDLSPHLHFCQVSSAGEIYVLIYRQAPQRERLEALQAILRLLAERKLHNPKQGLQSYVHGLQ